MISMYRKPGRMNRYPSLLLFAAIVDFTGPRPFFIHKHKGRRTEPCGSPCYSLLVLSITVPQSVFPQESDQSLLLLLSVPPPVSSHRGLQTALRCK